jgi:pimeloyl-ACP methyl ester carboxylesterase
MKVGAGPCACPRKGNHGGGCPYVFEDDTETVIMEDAGTTHPQYITLSGHAIHFWKGGAGPGLLLLHAAWGDAEMSWSRVWDQLFHSFTVVAPDLPGFGRSAPLLKPSLSAIAQKLKELIDALHLGQVIVVGNSLSAAVAIQIADEYPKAVSRLVLVNGGYMPLIPGPLRKVIALPIVNQSFRRLIRHFTFSPQTVKRSFADPSRLPAGFFEKIQENARAYARISFDIVMNMTEPQARPSVPTLLVWGARDGLATMNQAEALRQWIPGAKFVTIEDAGHMPQVEQPQEFAEVIRGLART